MVQLHVELNFTCCVYSGRQSRSVRGGVCICQKDFSNKADFFVMNIRRLAGPGGNFLLPLSPRRSSFTESMNFAAQALKKIPNGVKSRLAGGIFSASEMDARLATLRDYMGKKDLDATLLTSYHNINYFSGFLYCGFGRPYGLVVTQDKASTISANIDYGQPYRRSYGETDNIVYTDWKKDNFYTAVRELVVKDLKAEGKKIRLGIEHDSMSIERSEKLEDFVPECKGNTVDVGVPTMHIRMIKSEEEIQLIKNGARIADIGGAACVEAIDEGVPEHEVALHSTQAMIREIAKISPDIELMDTWTWFQSGINTDGAHNPVTTRKIEKGDILSLNCFPMIAGYYTALERTLFFDSCSDASIKIWEANCEVHRRGIELLKPGNRCGDIARELNEIFASKGLLQYRTFGYGHSFGSLCHYYGREAALELREDIDTVLEPGMVVSMEPMLTIPEGHPGAGGYREHDILVIEEKGSTNITGFPFGPEYNIVRK
ncbi:hypothetical protein AAMO2058_001482500 [Amorphochlora amoebiformis]